MATGYSATTGFGSPLDSAKYITREFFEWFGELGFFFIRFVRAAFTRPFEFGELLHQFDELGAKSLTLVALAGAATGIVLTLSTRDGLVRFGAKALLPAVVVRGYITQNFKVDDKRIRIIGFGKAAGTGESAASKIYIYIYPKTSEPSPDTTAHSNS